MPMEQKDDLYAEEAKGPALIVPVIQLIGGAFMVGGTIIGFNLGNTADMLGLADGFTERVFGGGLFVAGIGDFFIVPILLRKYGLADKIQ